MYNTGINYLESSTKIVIQSHHHFQLELWVYSEKHTSDVGSNVFKIYNNVNWILCYYRYSLSTNFPQIDMGAADYGEYL